MAEKDRDKLLQKACNLMAETKGYMYCRILSIDEHKKIVKKYDTTPPNSKKGIKNDATYYPCISKLEKGKVTVFNNPDELCKADVPPIVFLDGPIPPRVDTRPVDTQPLPQMSCPQDGGQTASLDASCDAYALEDAVSRATGWTCRAFQSTADPAYAVVIDCDGRAIELLSLPDQTPLFSGDARQAWLDAMANDRWPCFAGQSVQFTCMICLFP